MDRDDRQLLQEYAENQSQEAFRELVERHLAMVYAAACRTTGDQHLAKDIAQSVFSTLAGKAARLKASQTIGGWLYNTTRFLARRANRAEQRRRERERTAASLIVHDTSEDTGRVLDHLEPAMAELDEADRAILVLRYFEDRSLRSVGRELEISEDAARMRITRALERLRAVFAQQGISISAALLATLLASTTTSMPIGLAASVTAAALTTATTQATLITMTWLNLKTAAAILGSAAIVGTGTYWLQQRQIDHWQRESAAWKVQGEKMRTDLEAAHQLTQAQTEELERLRKDNADLFRLRNEVTQLRRQSMAPKQPGGPARSPALLPAQPVLHPGRFVARDELVFAGRATPEETMQSMTWAAVKGTFEETLANFSPELQQLLADPKRQEALEQDRQSSQQYLQGMQILARKDLGEEGVELKVKIEQTPPPNEVRRLPDLSIVKMIKVGDEWRFNQISRHSLQAWDQSPGVQPLVQ